ncbi:dsRBD fold-containing protein [Jiangella endophytica]|nr:dsRBD fold-containing protein [Jiangella endophytica]
MPKLASPPARRRAQIAAARAMRALADELLDMATADVEDMTHESVHLRNR